MKFDLDSGKLLYALGLLFAAAAFLYFIRDVVFGLSITVKAALLFVAFVAFFVAGVAIRRDVLDVVAFALSAIAYVVFLGYVIARYEPGETETFLLFAGSATLFVGLGYALRQELLSVSTRTAGYVIIGLLAASLVLIGADVLGGGVTYEVQLNDSVTVTAPDDVREERELVPVETELGSVTATNGFVFTRPLDLPTLRGCVVGTDRPSDDRPSVRYERRSYERSDTIAGGSERTYNLTVQMPIAANATESRTFAVERRSDCDVSRSDPTLIVVVGDDARTVD